MKDLVKILEFLCRMANGEDVVEYYNSEKTAKGARNSFLKFNTNVIKLLFMGGKNIYERDFKNKFKVEWENIEPLLNHLKNTEMSNFLYNDKLYKQDNSISDYNNMIRQGFEWEKPNYSFCYTDGYTRFGRYIAYCQVETQTSKKNTKQEYDDLYSKLLDVLKDYYGLYSSYYLPSFKLRYEHVNEREIKAEINRLRTILDNKDNIGKYYSVDQPTDKQKFWINKKLGVLPNNLNKTQANELLDVLFNGNDNKARSNPNDVLNFYKKMFGLTETYRSINNSKMINESLIDLITQSIINKIRKEQV